MKHEIKYVPIDKLKPFEKNPKRHPKKQIFAIAESMKKFGFTNPVLISEDNLILAGHARIEAAKLLKINEVPTIKLDMPYMDAVAYIIADNKLAELAEDNIENLKDLLTDIVKIPDFEAQTIGFTDNEIEKLLENVSTGNQDISDFIFDDITEPCWFVIRGNLSDYENIKNHLKDLEKDYRINLSDSHGD